MSIFLFKYDIMNLIKIQQLLSSNDTSFQELGIILALKKKLSKKKIIDLLMWGEGWKSLEDTRQYGGIVKCYSRTRVFLNLLISSNLNIYKDGEEVLMWNIKLDLLIRDKIRQINQSIK